MTPTLAELVERVEKLEKAQPVHKAPEDIIVRLQFRAAEHYAIGFPWRRKDMVLCENALLEIRRLRAILHAKAAEPTGGRDGE